MALPVFAWFLISLVASVALAPKPPRPRPSSLDDFDVPTAETDRPLPVLFGTKRITGANVCWYGDFGTSNIKQKSLFSSTTVGYRYYLGMHFGLCHGPIDEFSRLEIGDKVAWSGSSTDNETIAISEPDLFGGEQREGGVALRLDTMFGADDQSVNAYLDAEIEGPMPAFRGMFGVVSKHADGGGYIGNTPYLKPWAFTCKRIVSGWSGGVWYAAKAAIGTSMNPAHIVYQALTDPNFGQGSPTSQIDETSFMAAADTLFAEGFGLDLLWTQSTKVDDFLQIVIDHIGAVLGFDRVTNKYVLKLVRGDYDPGDLDVYDESAIESLEELQTQSWGETVNELTVTYTDPDTLKGVPITVQDLGNVRSQNAVVAETIDRSGISDRDLIVDVAARELAQRATPLKQLKIRASRRLWQHNVGDVVKISWAARGLNELVCRIMEVDDGTLEAGAITIQLIEDIYALTGQRYSVAPSPGVEPSPIPADESDDGGTPNVLSTLGAPPGAPADGDRYLVGAGATGEWDGHDGEIAEWDEAGNRWLYVTLPVGTLFYLVDQAGWYYLDPFGNLQLHSRAVGRSGMVATSVLQDTVAGTADEVRFSDAWSWTGSFSKAATTIRLRARGHYSAVGSDPTLRLRVYRDTDLLLDTGSIDVDAVTDGGFDLELTALIRETGRTSAHEYIAAIDVQGSLELASAVPGVPRKHLLPGTEDVVLDLDWEDEDHAEHPSFTVAPVELSAQWGAADAGNSITLKQFTVEHLDPDPNEMVLASSAITGQVTGAIKQVAYAAQLTSGAEAPQTWSIVAGVLPDGLSLGASTGLISGTVGPSVADGYYDFTVQVSGGGKVSRRAYTIGVGTAVALLHFDGADGSTSFPDETGRSWTAHGDAQVDDALAVFDESLLLDGDGDYLSTSSDADLELADDAVDFTISAFVRRQSVQTGGWLPTILAKRDQFDEGYHLSLDGTELFFNLWGGSGSAVVNLNSVDGFPGGVPIGTGVWYHVALTRKGTAYRMFVNGQLVDVATHGSDGLTSSGDLEIGRDPAAPAISSLLGSIDELWIVRGAALWVEPFTPPAAPADYTP